MRWLDRLEKHFGFIAIPNLILGVIVGQAVLTLAGAQHPEIPLLLQLDPAAVAAGQWYRLLSWVMVPSTSPFGLLFSIFWFWFLWVIGRTLEAEWGAFHCTVYLILAILLPGLASLLLYAGFGINLIQTGFYFSTSLQLAFAAVAPEFTLYFFFILPVKMRWWAWAVGAWLLYHAVTGGWIATAEVIFGVGNYLIFFLPQAIRAARQRQEVHANRRVFVAAKNEAEIVRAQVCCQCGAGREADLRLCTCERCGEDGKTWCLEHLKPHLSKVTEPEAEAPPPLPKNSSRKTAPKTKRKG